MTVGFVLGSGQVPYWAQIGSARGPLFNIGSIILNAPVGWLLPIIAAGLFGATFINQKPTIRSVLLLGLCWPYRCFPWGLYYDKGPFFWLTYSV
jgi:hypothetical protein